MCMQANNPYPLAMCKKTPRNSNVEAFQMEGRSFSFTSCNCRWDLCPLLLARKQRSKSSVGRTCFSETQEVQDAVLGWQGDGHCILGCRRRNSVRHLTKGECNIYANFLDQLTIFIREKRHGERFKEVLLQRGNEQAPTPRPVIYYWPLQSVTYILVICVKGKNTSNNKHV